MLRPALANRISLGVGFVGLALALCLTGEPVPGRRSLRTGARTLQEASSDVGFEVFRWVTIIVLLCLSAMFSGLTLGLLGLDTNQLAVSASSSRRSRSNPEHVADCGRIWPA
jgi:hypothetical protein